MDSTRTLTAKSHKVALCLLPPAALWQRVQRQCPAGEAAYIARSALLRMGPFQVTLSNVSLFEHSPSSFTVWMGPGEEGLAALQALQSSLEQAFPACKDLSADPARGISAFIPHLSLGQWRDREDAYRTVQELRSVMEPMAFDVHEVAIIGRQGHLEPFMLRALVPIGAATPLAPAGQPTTSTGTNDREVEGSTVSADTQAVDLQGVCRPFPPVPYVAYVSASVAGQQTEEQAGMAARPTTAEGLRARYGVGASASMQEGLWWFAFGADMASGVRGLCDLGVHPLESRPAVLKGHRLSFTHRGGLPNLEHSSLNPPVTSSDVAVIAASAAASTNADTCASGSSHAGACTAASGGRAATGADDEVHGMLHRLTHVDLARLTIEHHEFWPVVVSPIPYPPTIPSTTPTQSEAMSPTSSSSSAAAAAAQPQALQALAFCSAPDRIIASGLLPPAGVVRSLLDAAQRMQLSAEWQQTLAQAVQGAQAEGTLACTQAPDGSTLREWRNWRTGSQEATQGRRRGQWQESKGKAKGK